MTFKTFNLEKVLLQGAQLMGSEGREFEPEEGDDHNSGENLARQRAALNEQLGMPGAVVDDLVSEEDLVIATDDFQEEQQNKVRDTYFNTHITYLFLITNRQQALT